MKIICFIICNLIGAISRVAIVTKASSVTPAWPTRTTSTHGIWGTRLYHPSSPSSASFTSGVLVSGIQLHRWAAQTLLPAAPTSSPAPNGVSSTRIGVGVDNSRLVASDFASVSSAASCG